MKRLFLLANGVILTLVTLHAPLRAEEGMWTFDNPPTRLVQEKYNFAVTPQWLDHVRLSSIRLNDGGSGSFVSPNGLLLTNHHVALGQLQKNSTPEHDYVKDGFYARTPEEEIKSPDLEVNVLVSMENVTARVQDALKGARTPEQEFAKRKDVIAAIERESLRKRAFDLTWSRCTKAANTGCTATRNILTCVSCSRPSSRSRSTVAIQITLPIRAT